MTKQEAVREFRDFVLPGVVQKYGKNDKPAKSEAWSDFTDALCKQGFITLRQYETWTNDF